MKFRMKKTKIVKTGMDPAIEERAGNADHKTLATWAADCAERVLPNFEAKYPGDTRPRDAISALRAWIRTGEFHMSEVRKASLAAHAAARSVEEDDAARSAARAARPGDGIRPCAPACTRRGTLCSHCGS
jgi:hypothetical protein